ncbi:ECF transporter S component [Mesorhizobium sp. STM 4661]|uniref:ECF transporter S component n=1 Tax=Mesorhizobium sp. STM 4661 TaxID=1297570 RepID=UPI0002BDEF85|nr:ECF transporter S component [Mesorhizobium sp. STM 4661]CCV15148.1 conserved membrane hypothetical protein [Mesorhizobium sp. STM 4661]
MTADAPQPRSLVTTGGVSIGGAPVSYTAILAALVAVLAFIPASIVVGGMGGGWPLHDVIHPLLGLLLGPIAGPIASVIGIVVGNVIAPYTNLGPWSPLMGAMSAFAVGMVMYPNRSLWYVPWVITLAANLIYLWQSLSFGIGFWLWLSNVFTVDVALILIAIPRIRNWAIDQIRNGAASLSLYAAYFVVFFFGSTAGIQLNWVPSFATNPWPAEVWPPLIFIIFLERVVFTAVGALVAFALIAAIRRSPIAKAKLAGY